MTVLPRSAGTFLMSRSEISLKDAAVSRMLVISPAETPSSPSRCRCVNAMLTLLTLRSRPRPRRPTRRAGPAPARGARWGCSCRRSRRGSEARDDPARADADQRQILGPLVVLEDLVRDADQGALDAERVHHLPPAVGAHRRPPDTKKPPRLSREACSCATEIVGVMREPFLTSPGQVKRRRNVSGVSPNYAATERLSRLRPCGLASELLTDGLRCAAR